jgi:hypothetical protein
MIEGRLPVAAPAELRLRRIMGSDHPLWPAALETIDRFPPSKKRLGDQTWPEWFRYLERVEVHPLEATSEQVDGFLVRFQTAEAIQRHRSIIRSLYRSAFDLGLIAGALIPDVVPGRDYRATPRLSAVDLDRLVRSLDRDAQDASRALRARRDLVLVALACSFECSTDALLALTWGGVDLEHRPALLRIGGDAGPEHVALAEAVVERIIDLRTELERRSVVVVPEDALLPAVGRRIEWDWTLPERSLLMPLERGSMAQAFKVMRRRASIEHDIDGAKYFSHHRLLRDPADLNTAIRGTRAAGKTKVAMRRSPLLDGPAA